MEILSKAFLKQNSSDKLVVMYSQALLKIFGIVQGVAYRANASRKAVELGLFGYAKNLENGDVEILVQGEKIQIDAFIKWAYIGPSSAKVENMDVFWQEPKEALTKFSIC